MIRNFIIIVMLLNLGLITTFAQKSKHLQKSREVTIYLLKEADYNEEYDPENPLGIFPVKRKVNADNPIFGTLKALVKGANRAEERRKYHSSTFGIQFLSVNLQKGKATAHFTMPETASFGGDNSVFIFKEAVRKTVMQFKVVKEVVVCLDGEANFEDVEGLPSIKC